MRKWLWYQLGCAELALRVMVCAVLGHKTGVLIWQDSEADKMRLVCPRCYRDIG